jgi:hypothetical protein
MVDRPEHDKPHEWLTVTQAMIDEGVRLNCRRCPIASALRQLPGVRSAVVTRDRIFLRFFDERPERTFRPSRAMIRFIHRFDEFEPVRPTRFRLPAMST